MTKSALITVRIETEYLEKMIKIAEKRGSNMSTEIRHFVYEYVDGEDEDE